MSSCLSQEYQSESEWNNATGVRTRLLQCHSQAFLWKNHFSNSPTQQEKRQFLSEAEIFVFVFLRLGARFKISLKFADGNIWPAAKILKNQNLI